MEVRWREYLQITCMYVAINCQLNGICSSYRAERLIHRSAEIDPEYYHEYLRSRRCDRPNTPQRIQQGLPGRTMRGSSGNIIAALTSFFIPGLGQLVQGRALVAIGYFAIMALLLLVVFASFGLLTPLVLVVMIVSCVDAVRWNG